MSVRAFRLLISSVTGERRRMFKLAAALALLGVLAGGLVVSRTGLAQASDWVRAMTDWARAAGPAGWLVFAAAQAAVAMVGVLPASLLGLAAGAIYGIGLGFVLSAAGTMAGGWIAFVLARTLFRPTVARMLARRRDGSRLAKLDAEVTRDGWRFVCLLRISPVMPFAVTSYALGLTEIALRDYLLGTLASLPALLGYVAAGALARYGMTAPDADGGGVAHWVLLAAGVAATLLLLLRSGALLARCGLLPGSSLQSAK